MNAVFEPGRNIALARVWAVTAQPIVVAEICDDLFGRGFMPAVTLADGTGPLLQETGLADAHLAVGGETWRFVNLSSTKGDGCVVTLETVEGAPLDETPQLRHVARNARLMYRIESGGPSHSDRNLCENLAEILLSRTEGIVVISGRGTRGNRPMVYTRPWLGGIRS